MLEEHTLPCGSTLRLIDFGTATRGEIRRIGCTISLGFSSLISAKKRADELRDRAEAAISKLRMQPDGD